MTKLIEQPVIDNPHMRALMTESAIKVNGLAAGSFAALDGARDTAPTEAGADGDFVKKQTRAVAGTAGARYILDGWECVGGTWYERRLLTGT